MSAITTTIMMTPPLTSKRANLVVRLGRPLAPGHVITSFRNFQTQSENCDGPVLDAFNFQQNVKTVMDP
jgi:hypothetical protein